MPHRKTPDLFCYPALRRTYLQYGLCITYLMYVIPIYFGQSLVRFGIN